MLFFNISELRVIYMLSKIVDESLRIWMWQGMNRKGSKLLLVICTSSTIS
jgi:hypothetical protein